ncbi:MAG: transglycosylase SLT domain-containing protein [Longimicrobiales bacterium]
MKRVPLLLACLAALLFPAAALPARGVPGERTPPSTPSPLDSAREEMRAGRHWHATRILRGLGADTASDPALRLLLARAEAGWGNWAEVAPLLEGPGCPGSRAGAEELFLLGRALEESARHEDALEAYRAFLRTAGPADGRRGVAMTRLARVALAAGRTQEAVETLGSVPASTGVVLSSWAALEGAELRARAGDTVAVALLLGLVRDGGARDAAWRVLPRARLAAGDSAGAGRAWVAARVGGSPARRGEAATEAGRLALARGDSAAARRLLLEGLEVGRGAAQARAAASLLSFQDADLARTLRIAAALDGVNDRGPALRAYDRAERIARESGASLPGSARLSRARLMSTVASRHTEALEEFRALRANTRDPGVGALNLDLWARLRERQGRGRDAETIRGWLLEEYPGSAQAAEVMWARAQESEAAGRLDAALRDYATLARRAPDHARSGQGRMRTGQVLLGRGDRAGAARVWEAYLEDFPAGRRWQEASYWAARMRLELGQEADARRILARLRREDPVSYYAVMGADLLREPYTLALPPGDAALPPPWLGEGMARLRLLRDAGLTAGAEAEVSRITGMARSSPEALLSVAEALVEGGWTIEGINLGWELREAGVPWDRRLLAVVFPFPYRELIVREAAEWGLDPILMASLIRQESAFKPDIRSPANAVGLMQVLPGTGAELARRHGPARFREGHLEVAEVNLHLGAAFYRDMSRRYGGDLALTLVAYNAGPARATRWRSYPEMGDPARFTERIPFDETRGYVKNIRRNVAVYRILYGVD